jgi:glycosyltransferase involved in cell wall biosynthesis
MPPKVSVCLPVYNGARYLPKAIESVLKQSLSDFELLIADDGSMDASSEVISGYAAQDKRIVHWTNPSRLGLFGNYNACLRKASGKFIKPFAQDDLLQQDALERMSKLLEEKREVALVSSGKSVIDESGHQVDKLIQFPTDRVIRGKEAIIANLILLTNWVGEPSAVMFRACDAAEGFDLAYYHYGDIEYWFRLLAGGDLFYISDALYSFRRHEESSTTANLAGLYFALDIMRLGQKYRGYIEEIGESEEHFAKRAAEKIALHVDHLVRNEELTLTDVIAAGPYREGDSIASDDPVWRSLLFHSMRRITSLLEELIRTQNQLEHRQAECERLREAVNQMSSSVSWRLTAPLRTVRSKIGPVGP